MRDRGHVPDTLDSLLKSKNIPDAHYDAFRTGFAEGFLKAQALTQRTQGTIVSVLKGEGQTNTRLSSVLLQKLRMARTLTATLPLFDWLE